jgi:hypothetical protein
MAQQADGSRQITFTPRHQSAGPHHPPHHPTPRHFPVSTPPPIAAVVKPPGHSRELSRSLWVASFVAGIAVVWQQGSLAATPTSNVSKASSEAWFPTATPTQWTGPPPSCSWEASPCLPWWLSWKPILLAVLFKRRIWARWALAPSGPPTCGGHRHHRRLRRGPWSLTAPLTTALLAAQFILAAAGLILLFLPAIHHLVA